MLAEEGDGAGGVGGPRCGCGVRFVPGEALAPVVHEQEFESATLSGGERGGAGGVEHGAEFVGDRGGEGGRRVFDRLGFVHRASEEHDDGDERPCGGDGEDDGAVVGAEREAGWSVTKNVGAVVGRELRNDADGQRRERGGRAVFAFEVVAEVVLAGDGADELDALGVGCGVGDADEER